MGSAGGTGTSTTSFRVRGIPGVGIYVDGVYQVNTAGMLTEDFVDLDRLEVLRGPQGTLFGRGRSAAPYASSRSARPTSSAARSRARSARSIATMPRPHFQFAVQRQREDQVHVRRGESRRLYPEPPRRASTRGGIDPSNLSGDIVWTPTDKFDIRALFSSYDSAFIEPRVADAVWLGSAFYPATAGLLYDNAGMPYSQISQMSGLARRPGRASGRTARKSRSRTIRPGSRPRWTSSSLSRTTFSLIFLTGYTDLTTKIFIDYDNSQWGLVEDTSNSTHQPVQRGD